MSERRRTFLALAAGAIAALGFGHRRRRPDLAERTPPGTRAREIALGTRTLYVREDLFRSGWIRDLTFHDGREDES